MSTGNGTRQVVMSEITSNVRPYTHASNVNGHVNNLEKTHIQIVLISIYTVYHFHNLYFAT